MPVWDAYAYPNVTGFYDSILYANNATGKFFGNGLVFTIWTIFFIIFRRQTRSDMVAFASASFVTLVLSSILWAVGLVDESMLLILGVLTGASVVFMRKDWYATA